MRVKITPCEKRRRAPGRENRVNSPLSQLTVGRFSFFCYVVVHDIWYPSLSGRGCDRVSVCWGWKKRFIWSLHPCNDEVLRTPQEDAHAQCKSDALAATKGRGAERRLINNFFLGGGGRGVSHNVKNSRRGTSGNSWWGCAAGFPNPNPISDQKMSFSTPVFRPGL